MQPKSILQSEVKCGLVEVISMPRTYENGIENDVQRIYFKTHKQTDITKYFTIFKIKFKRTGSSIQYTEKLIGNV